MKIKPIQNNIDIMCNTIVQMVNLTVSKNKDKVLLVPISIQALNYDEDKEDIYYDLTLVINSPYNYCFVGVTNENKISLNKNEKIEFICYHDSCWRDNMKSYVNKEYRNFIDKINHDSNEDSNVFIYISNGLGCKLIDGRIEGDFKNKEAYFNPIHSSCQN